LAAAAAGVEMKKRRLERSVRSEDTVQRSAGSSQPQEYETTVERNEAHRQLVAARLSEQLQHGALEAALTELTSIALECDRLGVEFAMFSALDELMAEMVQDANLGVVIGTDGCSSGPGCAAAAVVLTLVGRYCQLWERPALALGHFCGALEASNYMQPDVVVTAQLGRGQCAAMLGRRTEAHAECMRWWTKPSALPAMSAGPGQPSSAIVSYIFLLTELAAEQPPPSYEQGCAILAAVAPFLGTNANFAIEPLAQLWLPSLLKSSMHGRELQTEFILRALRHSRVFASGKLEPFVCKWRHQLLLEMPSEMHTGIATQQNCDDLVFASAVACHEGFCEWASNPKLDEGSAGELLSEHAARVVALPDRPEKFCLVELGSVLAVAMHGPLLPQYSHVKRWWRAVKKHPQFEAAGLDKAVRGAVDEVLKRLVVDPRQEHEVGDSLRVLRPKDSHGATNGVEEFYSSMVYPPWHACEAVGLSPLPIVNRMRQQDPAFTWAHGCGSSSAPHRVLIAGCGSGHQLALTQRLLSGVHLVGLDLSRRALGYASRRLHEQPVHSSDTTMELLVGDILDLSPDRLLSLWPEHGVKPRLFEMVCCGGVLHHLADPPSGLAALRSVLKPDGVLQLATYRCEGTIQTLYGLPM
jgi:hypothetical protein